MDYRFIVQPVAVLASTLALLLLTGCAEIPNQQAGLQPGKSRPVTAGDTFREAQTGSMLPGRDRIGALPIDIYSIESLHQQGITSAAGAVAQIPQNNPR